MSEFVSTWSPAHIPASTTLKSIPASFASGVPVTLAAAVSYTGDDFVGMQRTLRGAAATLTIISNQEVLATATNEQAKASATQAIFDATLNLQDLYRELSFYNFYLSRFGNIFFFAIFSLLLFYFIGMVFKSRYWWFNITFICGYALEWMGFLGRILSMVDNTDLNYFLLQTVTLTIAPALIMAGIYFLFAQLVVIYGRKYSVLKPLWYTYLFITIDVLSLAIQSVGGAISSINARNNKDPTNGTNIMIAGIATQVFGMSVFIIFWFDFLIRIYGCKKRNVVFLQFLFNQKSITDYRTQLEPRYNRYTHIKTSRYFAYFPLAVTIAVIVVYIRSVYRVVELAQGYDGYLFSHEVYLFTLDASMIAICGLIFVPFHPVWVFGQEVVINFKTIHANEDIETNEKLSSIDNSKTVSDSSSVNNRKEFIKLFC